MERRFRESDKSLKHELGSILRSNLCLARAVVAFRSLTLEVSGSNPATVMTNIFSHWIQPIQWKHLGKSQVRHKNSMLLGHSTESIVPIFSCPKVFICLCFVAPEVTTTVPGNMVIDSVTRDECINNGYEDRNSVENMQVRGAVSRTVSLVLQQPVMTKI